MNPEKVKAFKAFFQISESASLQVSVSVFTDYFGIVSLAFKINNLGNKYFFIEIFAAQFKILILAQQFIQS